MQEVDLKQAESFNVICFILSNRLVNENGSPIEFRSHRFLIDPYLDYSPRQVTMKCAQIGWSTLAILKSIHLAQFAGANIIHCVDSETELLSDRGWLKHDEIKVGDRILTIKENFTSRWSKVNEVFVKQFSGIMVLASSVSFSSLTTTNHRWLVEKRRRNGKHYPLWITTNDLGRVDQCIPKCAFFTERVKERYNDDFIRLVGWVVTEGWYDHKGSFDHTTIRIAQSERVNSIKVKEIRECIKRLGVSNRSGGLPKEYLVPKKQVRYFCLSGYIPNLIRKTLPDKILTPSFINSLTNNQRSILLETIIDGDGWKFTKFHGKPKYQKRIIQKDKRMADMITMLAVLCGYGVSVKRRIQKDKCYVISLFKTKWVWTNNLKTKKIKYSGAIWCPSTRDGTFLARRDGTIYWTGNTFPSRNISKDFVVPKVDPLIQRNPVIQSLVGKDSVYLKQIGERFIYYRGSYEEQEAISISAHILIHDEYDRSNQKVLKIYRSRLDDVARERPELGWEWQFSNPSIPGYGVDVWWKESDQKHWFVKCRKCGYDWYLKFPENINFETEEKICAKCHKPLSQEDLINGRWVKKFLDRKISGYWISQMMVPWISAGKIIEDSKGNQDIFHNFYLGLPFISKDTSVSRDTIIKCLTPGTNPKTNVAIGVDNGVQKHYVVGNRYGIFEIGVTEDWKVIENLRNQYGAVMVIDALPYPHTPQELSNQYTGKIFVHYYQPDRKKIGTIRWEDQIVRSDRTKIIDAVVGELNSQDIVFNFVESQLEDYIYHWGQLYRRTRLTPQGILKPEWATIEERPDHYAHATILWRIALEQTIGQGSIVSPVGKKKGIEHPFASADQTVPALNLKEVIERATKRKRKRWQPA